MEINWAIIVPIVLTGLLLLAGGYIRNLLKEVKELIIAIADAFEDNTVDEQELAEILKEAKEVGASLKNIILAIGSLRSK